MIDCVRVVSEVSSLMLSLRYTPVPIAADDEAVVN